MIRVGIMGLGQIAHRVAKGICYAELENIYLFYYTKVR